MVLNFAAWGPPVLDLRPAAGGLPLPLTKTHGARLAASSLHCVSAGIGMVGEDGRGYPGAPWVIGAPCNNVSRRHLGPRLLGY